MISNSKDAIALRLKLCIYRMTCDKSPQKAGRDRWLVKLTSSRLRNNSYHYYRNVSIARNATVDSAESLQTATSIAINPLNVLKALS
jgi:hypothetical protein